jgi:hypothetical protein
MVQEQYYLEKCRVLIEQKIGWGSSEGWQNQDFENLSAQILAETQVSLSASTLKRLWGRVRYDSEPNLSTLDALARFAGYTNWRMFTSNGNRQGRSVESLQQPEKARKKAVPAWFWAAALLLFAAALAGLWAFRRQTAVKTLRFGALRFSSKPVATGMPNTVLFQYDAADSNADSVFIQQSWDARRRFRVDKNKHEYASTYYYPGYYRAKLILDDSTVREHDVYLKTEGWLGTVDKEPIPLYFTPQQIQKAAGVGVSEADLLTQKIDLQKDIPWVSLYDVRDFGELRATDFSFETELRSTFQQGDAVCQFVRIAILCSDGHFFIPLSAKGCVGELNLTLNDLFVNGQTADLSGFGTDFDNWVKVRMEVKNKNAFIFINERRVYQAEFQKDPGKVVGLRVRFHGAGAVRFARLGAENL